MLFYKSSLSLILFWLVLMPSFTASAMVSKDGTFGVRPAMENDRYPSWFIYELRPGESFEDELFVENQSDENMRLRIYAQDTLNASKDNAEFKIFDEGKVPEGHLAVSKWITLQQTTIDLSPFGSIYIPFKVTVPQDISKKEYAAVIFAHRDPTDQDAVYTIRESDTTVQAKIGTRVGARMYLTVTDNPVMPKRFLPNHDMRSYLSFVLLFIIITAIFGGGYFIFQQEIHKFFIFLKK